MKVGEREQDGESKREMIKSPTSPLASVANISLQLDRPPLAKRAILWIWSSVSFIQMKKGKVNQTPLPPDPTTLHDIGNFHVVCSHRSLVAGRPSGRQKNRTEGRKPSKFHFRLRRLILATACVCMRVCVRVSVTERETEDAKLIGEH